MTPSYIRELLIRGFIVVFAAGIVGKLCWTYGSSASRTTPLAGGQKCKPLPNRNLRVGFVPWAGFAGAVLANGGFESTNRTFSIQDHAPKVDFIQLDGFEREEKELFLGCVDPDPDKGVEALLISIQSWAVQFPRLIKAGIRARAVAELARSSDVCGIVADDKIDTLNQLSRNSLAVPQFSTADWLAKHAVPNQRAIYPKATSQETLAAFLDRNFDAVGLCEPYLHYALQRPGAHKLDSGTTHAVTYVLVVRENVINDHRGEILKLLQSWLDGNQDSPENPDIVKELFLGRSSVPYEFSAQPVADETVKESIESEMDHTQMADLAENVRLFGVDAVSSAEEESPPFDEQFRNANQTWASSSSRPEEARDVTLMRDLYRTSVPIPGLQQLCSPGATVAVLEQAVVRFDTNSFEISQREDLDSLKKIALRLTETGERPQASQACIVGYTDGTGDDNQNKTLSLDRAKSVAAHLREAGVGRDLVFTSGRGKHNPVASNATVEGRALNRRAEIRVVQEGEQ